MCIEGAVKQVGDPKSPGNLHGHRYASSPPAAAADALEAGCDVDYGGGYSCSAQAAVDQGLTSEAVVAAAVRRSLSTRMRMGEFDKVSDSDSDSINTKSIGGDGNGEVGVTSHINPWSSSLLNLGVIDSKDHRALAWRAAVSTIVLLENANGALGLPIKSSGGGGGGGDAGGSSSDGMVIAVLGTGH